MKEEILHVIRVIVEEELAPQLKGGDAVKTEGHTYFWQRALIRDLFEQSKGRYDVNVVTMRLMLIETLYSTNAHYCYFAFDDMAHAICEKLGSEEEARRYFYGIACGGADEEGIFSTGYGLHKNLDRGGQQMSLLSKYAYYALLCDGEKYPLGFPIYDSLAKSTYPQVCGMLGHKEARLGKGITSYVSALGGVRKALFGEGDALFEGFQQFDVLDAYLWRMGKFTEGNMSLLLKKEDYMKFVENLDLIGNSSNDFNAKVLAAFCDEGRNPFKGISTEGYMTTLLKHWRKYFAKENAK